MGIQCGAIHNLVRTYQRVLNLESPAQVQADLPSSDADDRVSISEEARHLQQRGDSKPTQQGSSSRR